MTGSVTAKGSVGADELEPSVGWAAAPGAAVVLHPRRRVSEGQRVPIGATSSGISAMASAPCIASASSRVIGWPAR